MEKLPFTTDRGWLRPSRWCWHPTHMVASGADIEGFIRDTVNMPTENSSIAARDAVTTHIIDLIGQRRRNAALTAYSSLQSQGLDSLKVMSLVFKLEEHYDIVLDEADADDLRTVDDLAALVVRRIEEQS